MFETKANSVSNIVYLRGTRCGRKQWNSNSKDGKIGQNQAYYMQMDAKLLLFHRWCMLRKVRLCS